MKVSIIVPVFNEATTAEKLLDLVWSQPLPGCFVKELVIVESDSTDGSREIVSRFASRINERSPGAVRLLFQDRARGKGHAVRHALGEASGDIILIQDCDLEYDVKDYPLLLQPFLEETAEFVLGSRYLAAGHWRIRRFDHAPWKALFLNLGGVFFHGLFNIVYRQNLTDPTTMFKVFKRDCLRNFDLVSDHFDFDYELLAKLIRTGKNPIEVPVSYVSRGFKEGKKIRMFRDPLVWLIAIFRFRFSRIAEG